jgi:hypothetical protein
VRCIIALKLKYFENDVVHGVCYETKSHLVVSLHLDYDFLSCVTIFFFSFSSSLVLTHVLVYLTVHVTNLRSDQKSEQRSEHE